MKLSFSADPILLMLQQAAESLELEWPEALSPSTRLSQLDLDSIDMFALLGCVETQIGRTLPDPTPRPETLGELIAWIASSTPP